MKEPASQKGRTRSERSESERFEAFFRDTKCKRLLSQRLGHGQARSVLMILGHM